MQMVNVIMSSPCIMTFNCFLQPILENPPYSVITSFSSSCSHQSLTWYFMLKPYYTPFRSHRTPSSVGVGICFFLFTRHPFFILLPIFTIQGGDKILLYPSSHFLKVTPTHLQNWTKGHFSHPFNKPFKYISLIRACITLYCNWLFACTLLLLYQLEEGRDCVYFFTIVSLNSHLTSMLIINCSVNVLIWFTLILVIPMGQVGKCL